MSFSDWATVECSTKRATVTSGARGAPSLFLSNLKCQPLIPASAELLSRAALSTPLETWETLLEGDNDIKNGDILTINSKDYDIRAVWDYPLWEGLNNEESLWKQLLLEENKASV